MIQKNKNNIYTSRKQKEHILVAVMLGILTIIIMTIVISIGGKDSETYYIGPIVPWESETETEANTESETETQTDMKTEANKESETETQTEMKTETNAETDTKNENGGVSANQSQANNSVQPGNQEVTETEAPENLPEGLYYWNNHYYTFYDVVTSWEEAVAFCEEKGGYIASIASEKENDAVYGFMKEKGIENAYIGYYFDENTSTWQWVSGEELIYDNWSPGEPNRERGREKYAMFYYKYKTGKWNDGDFGKYTHNSGTMFICEWNSYPENY